MSALRQALQIARVEIGSSFRDRQTILNAVVLPLVLYPALFWIMLQGLTIVRGRALATTVSVLVVSDPASADATAALFADAETERMQLRFAAGPRDAETIAALLTSSAANLPDSSQQAAPAGELDAVLVLPSAVSIGTADQPPGRAPAPPAAALYFDGTSTRAGVAADRLRARLSAYASSERERAARSHNAAAAAFVPFEVAAVNLASERDMGGFVLSFLLPLLLVVMTVMGAFMPAVDVTAGERERGTLETTLLHPVTPAVQQFGRILAVAALGLLAAALNLASLGLAARTLLSSMLGSSGSLAIELPLSALLGVTPLALLFAVFVAAVLTAAASLAESFKQAQSSLGPVQLLFFLPAFLASMPGMVLTPGLACVPVVGFVLAFKSMLQTGAPDDGQRTLALGLVAATLLLFTAGAVWLSTALYSREGVRVRAGRLSVRDALRQLFRTSA